MVRSSLTLFLLLPAVASAGPAFEAAIRAVEEKRAVEATEQTVADRVKEESRQDFLARLNTPRKWVDESLAMFKDVEGAHAVLVRTCTNDELLVTDWNMKIDEVAKWYDSYEDDVNELDAESLAYVPGGYPQVAARGFRTWDDPSPPARRGECVTPPMMLHDHAELYNKLQAMGARVTEIENRVNPKPK